jgi:hypothetical protein
MEPVAPSRTLSPGKKRIKMLRTLAFVVGGAIMGFGYYKLVGCRTGACPITSSPVVSTLYGAVMGYLMGAGG